MKKFYTDIEALCGLTVAGTTSLSTATGVTVATSDNSTKLATTAFVKNQGYLTTETDTLDSVTDRGSVTTNSIGVGTVNIIGTTAGAELLTVDGTFGRLFTVTDDLSDSLFSVNTVAGLPVIEVFADNTINLGAFSNPIVIDSSSNIVIPGTITASGYNSTNWNTAYNDRIVSAAVTGTTTKTLTLTQTDGGTISTSWTDINTDTDGYISNVSLVGSTLSFTSVGSAFSGIVDLSTLTPTVRTVYETVRNVSGATILKGTPLAVVAGQTSGNVSDVVPANAADPTKMPAVFIANQNIADQAEGEAILFGYLQGVDTSAYTSGTTVYVAPGGGWTATKPVWPNKIQNLGVITKQHATNGAGIVTGVGRANDLPNLTTGKIWVGTANYPIESTTVHVDEANNRLGINTTNPGGALHVVGSAGNVSKIYYDLSLYNSLYLTDGNWTAQAGIAGLSGNLLFYSNSGGYTEKMRLTGGGNLGIGTTNPAQKLDVNGNVNIGGGIVYLGQNTIDGSSDNFKISADSSNVSGSSTIEFLVDGSEKARIDNNGNVGIGTTSPSAKLSIVGDSELASFTSSTLGASYSLLKIFNLGPGSVAWRGNVIGANIKIVSNAPAIDVNGFDSSAIVFGSDVGQGFIKFFTTNAATTGTALSERMMINPAGNVGIGTTSPLTRLTLSSAGDNFIYQTFDRSTGGANARYWQQGIDVTHGFNWGRATDAGVFTSYMKIDSTGNVGIGTTSPTQKLDVVGSAKIQGNIQLTGQATGYETSFNGSSIYSAASTFNGEASMFGALVLQSRGDSGRPIVFVTGGTPAERMRITDTGNVGIGTSSPLVGLDVRGTAIITNPAGTSYNENLRLPQATSGYAALTLGGSIAASGTSAAQWTILKYPTNNNFAIRNNNSDLLYITTTGNVGIGTTSPNTKLHIVGAGSTSEAVYLFGDSNYGATIHYDRGGSYGWRAGVGGSGSSSTIPSSTWGIEDASLGVSRLVVTHTTGNVGIGTTAPSYKLDVNGSINTTEFNINSINQVTGVAYMEPIVSSGFWSRSSATDEWVKVISVSGTPRRIRLSLFAGGDNTNSYEEYMISHSGYGMQTHIHRLPGSRYNTSKVVGIKVINPTGSTQEVWVKLLGMTAAPGDFTYRSNVAVLDSATVAASSQSAEPTSTTGSSVLLFDATDRNIYTTMSSGGAMFNNDVKLNHGGRIYGNGTNAALFLNNASGSFLEYSTSNRVGVGSGVITLTTGGSERVRIDLVGNVGIGTTTPTKKLEVRQTGIAASFGSTFSPGSFAGIHFGYSEATNDNYKKSALVFERTDNHGQGGNASGKIHFLLNNLSGNSATSLAHSVVTIDTDAVATQGSARVGIGTSSPQEAVHVKGNVRIDGSSTAAILETGDKTAGEGGVVFESYDVGTTYGAFVDYVIYDTTRDNMRTGTLRAVWNTGQAAYTDVSTVDIGDTTNVVLYADIDGTNVNLIVNGPTSFTIKYNLKLIK